MAPTTIVIAIAIIAVHFVLREAVFEHAFTRRSKTCFPPVYGLRVMFWLGIPVFLLAAFKVCAEMRSILDWIYPLVFVGLALLAFFSYPGTICLDNDGITTKRLLGLRVKRLSWDEIASAVQSIARKEVTVFGKDGGFIVHTRFHVDPSRFEAELRTRLKTPVIHQ